MLKSVINFFQSTDLLNSDKIYQHQFNLKTTRIQIAELEIELQKFKVKILFAY
jgi:hypothetical protein